VEGITTLVRDIAAIRVEDGLRFDADWARGETIREEDLYSGVRVHLSCQLASALTHLTVDVNVGDPITPAPQHVHVPRLLDQGDTIDLVGYPLPMVYAEKIVTAIQRGAVNTRWRDFADIYLLCHHQPVDAAALREALGAVAGHRGALLQPLSTVLAGYADAPRVQSKWAAWPRRQQLDDRLPESFGDVLSRVRAFADPVITESAQTTTWCPDRLTWTQRTDTARSDHRPGPAWRSRQARVPSQCSRRRTADRRRGCASLAAGMTHHLPAHITATCLPCRGP
jgi:hypothetical protein